MTNLHQLACYRVTIEAERRSALPWTMHGSDGPWLEPTRTSSPIIAALDEDHAYERARVVGKDIMGGRPVTIIRIEYVHPPGTHDGHH